MSFSFVVPLAVSSDVRLLTAEIVVLFHVLSDVDTETFYRMACRGTRTQTPYPPINVTLQQLHAE